MVIKVSKESMSVISRLLTNKPEYNNKPLPRSPYFGSVKELLSKLGQEFSDKDGGTLDARESRNICSLNVDEKLSRFIEERLESVAIGPNKWSEADLKGSTLFRLLREHLNHEGYDLYVHTESQGRMGDGEKPHEKLKVHVYQMSNDVLSSSEFLNINQDNIHIIINNIRTKIARGRDDDYEHAITDARKLLQSTLGAVLTNLGHIELANGSKSNYDKFEKICNELNLKIHFKVDEFYTGKTMQVKAKENGQSEEHLFGLFYCIMQFINKSANFYGAQHPTSQKPKRADAVFIVNATASFCIFLYDLYLIHKSEQAS